MTKDEAYYRERMASFQIPEGCRDGLVLYLLHGIQPGHFLCAVLSNDLRQAVARADAENQQALVNYVKFLETCAPYRAWGSVDYVTAWLEDMYAARHDRG